MPYTIGLLGSVPRLDAGREVGARARRGQPAVAGQPAAGLPVRAALPDGRSTPAARTSRRSPRPTARVTAPRAFAAARSPSGNLDLRRHLPGPAGAHESPSTPCPRDERPEVLRVEGLVKRVPADEGRGVQAPDRHGPRRRRRVASTSARARRSGWSASRAAARPPRCMQILDLAPPDGGRIVVLGRDVRHARATRRSARRCAATCRSCSRTRWPSLDPRMPVFDILAEPLRAQGVAKADRRPSGSASCSASSAWSRATPTATRSTSPAASASASASPARSRSSPS